jgi:hypothetical protein
MATKKAYWLIAVVLVAVLIALMLKKEYNEKNTPLDCSSFTDGIYYRPRTETDSTRHIVIEGNSHKEFHMNESQWIYSDIEWKNECECELTISEINHPEIDASAGDKMRIKITRIDGDIFYYIATSKTGEIKKGKFKKK